LNTIQKTAFTLGPYVVSPATHPTGSGRFGASFAVSRTAGASTTRDVFRLSRTFASCEAAGLLAVTQGWLHASMAAPPAG
jgi:hypothetical protein